MNEREGDGINRKSMCILRGHNSRREDGLPSVRIYMEIESVTGKEGVDKIA